MRWYISVLLAVILVISGAWMTLASDHPVAQQTDSLPHIEERVVGSNIFLLIFDNQQDVASTFLRFQEHYESPEFKGKVFTLDQFKKWYIQNSPRGQTTGQFTYYSDWNGFNVPSYVLQPFRDGKFDPLSDKEKQLLQLFDGVEGDFYVIGVHRGMGEEKIKQSTRHEVAHALFYIDPQYRHEALETLRQYDVSALRTELASLGGYADAVLEDECQAYSLFISDKLKSPIPAQLHEALGAIFQKYAHQHGVTLP